MKRLSSQDLVVKASKNPILTLKYSDRKWKLRNKKSYLALASYAKIRT